MSDAPAPSTPPDAAAGSAGAAPARRVPCPACGTQALFDRSNPFRPFCSGRCREIDLGAWASERFRVPGEADPQAPDPGSREG
jgi:uncharacterized protein